jgi:Arc/MetJ-type ribon-helix-helix transcriptional regulator
MTIDLDSETEKLLQRELETGRFSDAAALLSIALKQFLIAKELGEAEARKLAVLRAELDQADEQIERGEYTEYDDHRTLAKEIQQRGLKRLASQVRPAQNEQASRLT